MRPEKPRSAVMFEAFGLWKAIYRNKRWRVPEIITSDGYVYCTIQQIQKKLEEKILIASDKEWGDEKIRGYPERFRWENIAGEIIKTYETVVLHRRDHGIA
jgi:hypothetical protein